LANNGDGDNDNNNNNNNNNDNDDDGSSSGNDGKKRRLLLCKRWTVACSKSTRGGVNYAEALDFTQNWSKNRHRYDGSAAPSKTKKSGNGNGNRGANKAGAKSNGSYQGIRPIL